MAAPSSKRQKTDTDSPSPPYELLYWPSIPGRGEHIRLLFEATSTPYTDTCNTSPDGITALKAQISPTNTGTAHAPPPLAPPVLRHGDLLISQVPNICLYLGPRLGLAGDKDDPSVIYYINQLALTALDGLSNEAHDTHHPVATGAYYEEQKEEAKRKAKDYTTVRLPKFLGYFERVLRGEKSGGGEWLVAGQMTWADLVLWQCVDGVSFAFPRTVAKMRASGGYEKVFEHEERVRAVEGVKAYLGSERRLKYSNGVYRHYPELDLGAD